MLKTFLKTVKQFQKEIAVQSKGPEIPLISLLKFFFFFFKRILHIVLGCVLYTIQVLKF